MSHRSTHAPQPHNPQPVSAGTPTANPFSNTSTPGADASARHATADQIRERAYEISKARNEGPGNATSDWCQAEAELSASTTDKR